MAVVTSLRRTASAGSPPLSSEARDRLAEAIQELAAAEQEHAALDAAMLESSSAGSAEAAARDALERARAGLERAKSDAVNRLVSDALGTPGKPGMTIRDARAAVENAEDNLAAATAAREAIAARFQPAARTVERKQTEVHDRAIDVLREHFAPTIVSLLAEIDALHHQIADKGRLLEWLAGSIVPRFGPKCPPGLIEIMSRFTDRPEQWAISRETPSVHAWKAALSALKADAHAQLPGGKS